jgi:hypothetical protein
MSEPTGEVESWLTISEAASRLKLTPYGIRSRIRRGALRTKPGNDGRLLVAISAPGEGEPADQFVDYANGHEAAAEIEFWRLATEAARLEAGVLRAERDAAQSLVADLHARADRLEAALAEARKGWLERVLEALRRGRP